MLEGRQFYSFARNCHHAALLVYNHSCARAEDQMTTAPNKWLAKVAHYATKLGAFNSPRFVSEVADVKSEVGSGSGAQDCKLVDTPASWICLDRHMLEPVSPANLDEH